jgi:hypothetical protein
VAIVKTANQEIPIPDAWVALTDESQEAKSQRDARLRRLMGGVVPSINNAQLTYNQEEGKGMVVRVTTQLGTKATEEHEEGDQGLPSFFFYTKLQCDLNEVHASLCNAPRYLPPVLKLAWELKWLQVTGKLTFPKLLEYQPAIQKVLEDSTSSNQVEHIHQRLRDLPPAPAPTAPIGL